MRWAVQLVGHVEVLGLRRVVSAPLRSWLTCDSSSTGDEPPVEQVEEAPEFAVGLRDDPRDVAVVVLQPVLRARVQAAVDADDEQHEDEQADAGGDGAAHRELLRVLRPEAARRRPARARAGRGSSPSSKKDKKIRS